MSEDENSYYFWQSNPETGLVEKVDIRSGQVVVVQAKETPFEELKRSDCIEIEGPSGEKMLIQRGISQENLPSRMKFKYSDVFRDIFCQKLLEGMTATKIAELPEMPNYTYLCRMRSHYPDFKAAWDDARKIRADSLCDTVLDDVKGIKSSDESTKLRTKIDALKWIASVDNPDRYGNKTKITGDADNPIGFVIQSFISKEPLKEEPDEDLPEEEKESILEKTELSLIDNKGENNGEDS